MSFVRQYTQKPPTVEAMQWDGTEDDAVSIIGWIQSVGENATYWPDYSDDPTGPEDPRITIDQIDGRLPVGAGDWVVCPVGSDAPRFYPVTAGVFAMTYQAVQ